MKQQKQSPQILSPENSIRQRARNLPLFRCLVNEGWEEEGLAHATIARKHVNGNITYCSYLVDLKCLGVKDTIYEFNVLEDEFDEYREKLDTTLGMIESDYNLVHNIIHAGWEYAEDIGFEPHRDFLSITQYMLEEESDEIPLIEIACGDENGKPFFVQGPLEDETLAKIIINKLEKNVGRGNFNYVLGLDQSMSGMPHGDWDNGDWDDEDDDDLYDDFLDDLDSFYEEYAENSHEENIATFLSLTQYLEDMDPEGDLFSDNRDPDRDERIVRIEALADILYDELVDFKDVSKWLRKWSKESNSYTVTNNAFNQMLGLQDADEIEYEDLSYLTKEKEETKLMQYVREKWGELPYVTFLSLRDLDDVEEKRGKIAKSLKQYPDHALLRLEEKVAKIQEGKWEKTELSFKSIFGDRTEITPYEYLEWLTVKLRYFLANYDLAGIEGLLHFCNPENKLGPDYEDQDILAFFPILYAARVSVLRMFLKK